MFNRERVYSAVNADELKPGDKVIVADDLDMLKRCVKDNSPINTIHMIGKEDFTFRFCVKENVIAFALAYLVERAKNCTNCEGCGDYVDLRDDREKVMVCSEYKPNTEMPELISLGNGQYAEKKHCRPFKNADELIKTWIAKRMITYPDLCLPHIWVRFKDCQIRDLITGFGRAGVQINAELVDWYELYNEYEFLDGSVCGVEV